MSETALAESAVVGKWRKPSAVFVCPPPADDSDPCDCGYDGPWEWRDVFVWHATPGHVRGDKAVRRDLRRGLPPRYGDEGWWVIEGTDERCPGCGDIERFSMPNHELVASITEAPNNVVPLRIR